jgi:aspartate/methionine/tyrosine aminotransferase
LSIDDAECGDAVSGGRLSWCAGLLEETGIGVAPGVDFDRVSGGYFIRMCFAGETEPLAQAIDLLADWLPR